MTKIILRRSYGHVPYPRALSFMAAQAEAIRQSHAPEMLWFLEHPPLFTAGTSARSEDLTNPHGFDTFEAGRGGQWTYHGPGQRIVYVMLDLTRPHGDVPARDLRAFVQALERWIIRALALLGVHAETREGRIGVWVQDPVTGCEAKIAALGIRVSRWVSWHGVSINLDPVLTDFDGIVPCGIRDYGVTSLARFKPDISMPDLDHALLEAWQDVFASVPQEEGGG